MKNIMESDNRFINREMSWLEFNTRVLEEAENANNPIMERINFLAISASNLDEFYMIRVAGLKDYIRKGVTKHSQDGMTPQQELEAVNNAVEVMIERQHKCWVNLRGELKENNISIVKINDLSKDDLVWLERYFLENIFMLLTPIAIDPAHPFPFLPNLNLALVFELIDGSKAKKKKSDDEDSGERMTIIPLPARLPRFVSVPGDNIRCLMIEDVIEHFLPILMPNHSVVDSALFRIIRDSELEVDDDDDQDFVRNFEIAIKQRRRGRVIQIKFAAPASKNLVNFVSEQMHVRLEDVIEVNGMLGLTNLRELLAYSPSDLRFPSFDARFPERIDDFHGDCMKAIATKDIVIHHPFETFNVVIQFLKQAVEDPNVVSIKQTLYRTSKDSPIAHALIAAAEAGKSVTALVELKARFDEETNIRWARDLENAGVQVVYGFVTLKTHAKITLVTRRENDCLVSYAHFGTGNYHPTTAKSYTDLSFFTSDKELCHDAAYLFNFVTGNAPPREFKKLIIAPSYMRDQIISMIDKEIENVKKGKSGAIWAKMNSLVDKKVIDALYQASQAGVKIELIVRGICCLRPKVKGLSENITVKSIVGRFLEHSRIYCFADGHEMSSPETKVFIGSADWMPRNFDKRVEVMVPIENPTVHEQILGQIMMANIKDEGQSWILQSDGSYKRVSNKKDSFTAHNYFLNNPSLSGRGTSLKTAKLNKTAKAKNN
ncbi:MAG: RNA degradosome polyphosphate kinase [Rickettsiales bacterium]